MDATTIHPLVLFLAAIVLMIVLVELFAFFIDLARPRDD